MSRRARAYERHNRREQDARDAIVDHSRFPVCECGASYADHVATRDFTEPCAKTGCADYRAVTLRKPAGVTK